MTRDDHLSVLRGLSKEAFRYVATLMMRFLQGRLRRRPESRLLSSLGFRLALALARDENLLLAPLPHGGAMLVDARDPAQRDILLFGQTERSTTALMQRIATPGWTFLDVGANAGYYSIMAAVAGGASGRVHAFEPNPRMAELIDRSVRISADGHGSPITVVRAACGSRSGSAALLLSRDPSLVAFATLDKTIAWTDDWEEIEVRVVALDDYCRENNLVPDVVKIDAEGFEPQILEGMRSILERRQPRFVICEAIEGWGRPDPRGLVEFMSQFSYSLAVIEEDGGLRPAEGIMPHLRTSEKWGNVCFVAADASASSNAS